MDFIFLNLILVTLLTISSSGFLSFSEAAVMSLNKNAFLVYKSKHNKKLSVKALNKILENKNNYITTIIILNTIVNIGGSMIIGGMALNLFSSNSLTTIEFLLFSDTSYEYLVNIGISASAIFTIAFTLAILYFAEMIPKLIASQKPLPIALFVSIPLYTFEKLIKPIVWISLKICGLFVRNPEEPVKCLMEAKTIIKEANKDGLITSLELDIINNTFALSEKTVHDLMMCKTAIEYIHADLNVLENKNDIIKLEHKRIIVTKCIEGKENPIGVVVVQDLLRGILRNENKTIADYMHELLIVNETDSLSHILADFNNTTDHLALVQCKDGTYQGVLAVEDVLDSISIGFPN